MGGALNEVDPQPIADCFADGVGRLNGLRVETLVERDRVGDLDDGRGGAGVVIVEIAVGLLAIIVRAVALILALARSAAEGGGDPVLDLLIGDDAVG